jgi:flavin reductase (DIM6/NTAB) family NADH-FMN oxidoreductase RutF
MLTVAIRPGRHTYQGIKDNGFFSVNLPNSSQARETDLCGIVSGVDVNKAELCGFTLFFGTSGLAPMIEECPVNLECEVHQIIPLGSHDLVIARIVDTFVTDACLTEGKPDADKIDPLLYLPGAVKTYGRIGETVAKAFSAGLALKR